MPKILAGGHSLIPAMRFRLAAPGVLIDINRLQGLDYIREDGKPPGHRRHGPGSGPWRIPPSIQEPLPAAGGHGSGDRGSPGAESGHRRRQPGPRRSRQRPPGDHAGLQTPTIVAQGPAGTRTIAIDDFFTGLFENSLAADEILTEVRVPVPGPGLRRRLPESRAKKSGTTPSPRWPYSSPSPAAWCRRPASASPTSAPVPMRVSGSRGGPGGPGTHRGRAGGGGPGRGGGMRSIAGSAGNGGVQAGPHPGSSPSGPSPKPSSGQEVPA